MQQPMPSIKKQQRLWQAAQRHMRQTSTIMQPTAIQRQTLTQSCNTRITQQQAARVTNSRLTPWTGRSERCFFPPWSHFPSTRCWARWTLVRRRAADLLSYHNHTAIVGRLGTVALGAVGISNMCMNLSMMLFRFLTVVTTPAVAAAVAKNDLRKVYTRLFAFPPRAVTHHRNRCRPQ